MSNQSKSWPAFLAERPTPWQPSADVYRTKDGWLVKFDLAGVQIADVSVTLRGRRLSISGVRRDSFLEEGSSYYSMEISYNRFERSLDDAGEFRKRSRDHRGARRFVVGEDDHRRKSKCLNNLLSTHCQCCR